MKKTINLFKSALLAAALVFSFAACTNDAETSSNELAGKNFSYKDKYSDDSLVFTDDTITITETGPYHFTYYNNAHDYVEVEGITRKSVETYTYTIENDPDYLVCKLKKREEYYLKDGKVVYDRSLSDTLAAYTEKRRKFLEAILPEDASEETIKTILYDELYIDKYALGEVGITEDNYKEYKRLQDEEFGIEKKINFVMPYQLKDSSLKLLDEYFAIWVPEGFKLGDIFNEYYEYEAKKTDGCHISITSRTRAGASGSLYLYDKNPSISYTILSATNDKLKIAKASNGHDIYYRHTYDIDHPISCKVTYKEGKDKTIGTINIEGEEFTFDIQYLTNEKLDKFFKSGDEVIEFKQK